MAETCPATRPATGLLRGQRVLVVEDEYLLAEELRRALAAAGAEVIGPVPRVGAALAVLDRGPAPSLAVLDVNLQGEMVWPVAEALAARRIPFIFATGYEGEVIPPSHAHAPCTQKPVEMQQIMRMLARAARDRD